jgi:glycosyltransferase involved in cell wall biosynthesis
LRRSRIADAGAYIEGIRSGLPFLITRDNLLSMRQLIDQLATRHFDVVHADQLTMAQYALQFRRASASANGSPAIVFDAHNAVYEIVERARQTVLPFLRPVLALEARRLKQYEGSLIGKFDHTLAVSDIDKNALLNAAKVDHNNPRASKIAVIPIAVDCTNLQPVRRTGQDDNILTVSTLFYPPNADGVRWFIRQVFPLVKDQIPSVTLTIVGSRPPKDIVEFGIRNAESVQVTGYVPDLQEYFERAALMVVPVRAGSGMRVRILEALARGIPVVTTKTGVEGIAAINGEHLLVADEPVAFADAVVRLLKDRELGETLIRNGRQLAQEKYDWQAVLPKLESTYNSASR